MDAAACHEDLLRRIDLGKAVRVADYHADLGDELWTLVDAVRGAAHLDGYLAGVSRPDGPAIHPWPFGPNYEVSCDVGVWSGGRGSLAKRASDGTNVVLLLGTGPNGADRVERRAGVTHAALAAPVERGEIGGCSFLAVETPSSESFELTAARLAEVVGAVRALHAEDLPHTNIWARSLGRAESGGIVLLDAARPAQLRGPTTTDDLLALGRLVRDAAAEELPDAALALAGKIAAGRSRALDRLEPLLRGERPPPRGWRLWRR